MKKLKELLPYAFVFLLGLLAFALITEFDRTMEMFRSVTGWIGLITGKLLIGFGLAYFLNFITRFFERRKARRWLAVLITYVILFGFIALMGWLVVPAMIQSASEISSSLSGYYKNVMELLDGIMDRLDPSAAQMLQESVAKVTEAVTEWLRGLLSWDYLGGAVGNVTRTLSDLAFGLLISVYALLEKDRLKSGAKRIIRALFSDDAEKITTRLAYEADETFSRYIIGRVLGSILIGVVCLIAFEIARLPVAPFIAVVAMVTNMIPYFGPILGAVCIGAIELCIDPWSALIAVIIFIVIQSLDGAITEPIITGAAVRITPLLTIVSITIGGDLFGIAGIFFAAPVVSTLKTLISEAIDARIAYKERLMFAADPPEPEPADEPESPFE